MDESKITEAVETCLTLAIGTDRPFGRVTEFLNKLKANQKWTDAEVSEVQTRISGTACPKADRQRQIPLTSKGQAMPLCRPRCKDRCFLSHALAILLALMLLPGCDARSSALAKLEGKFETRGFCWSNDGKRIAAIAEYRDYSTIPEPGSARRFDLCVWDAHSSKLIWSKALPVLNKPQWNSWGDLRFSQDGDFILTSYVNRLGGGVEEAKVVWWRSSKGERLQETHVGGPFDGKGIVPPGGGNVASPSSCNFILSKDSKTVAIVDSYSKSCSLVDAESGKQRGDPLALKDVSLLWGNSTYFEMSDNKISVFDNETSELRFTWDTTTEELVQHPARTTIDCRPAQPDVAVKDASGQTTHTIKNKDVMPDTKPGDRVTFEDGSGHLVSARSQNRFHEFQSVSLSPDKKYLSIFYSSYSCLVDDNGSAYQVVGNDGFRRGLWAIWDIDNGRTIISGQDGQYGRFSPTDRVFLLANWTGGGFKKIAY